MKQKKQKMNMSWIVGGITVVALGWLLAWMLLRTPDATSAKKEFGVAPEVWGPAQVTFYNVGQGDATIIKTADQKVVMIDAGGKDAAEGLANEMKSNGIIKIDVLIITQWNNDHCGGIPAIMDQFDVGRICVGEGTNTSESCVLALSKMKDKGIEPEPLTADEALEVGDVQLQVIGPVKSNYQNQDDQSLVIRFVHGEDHILFAGDEGQEAQEDIIAAGYDMAADVLKVSNHGHVSGTSTKLINEIKPNYAVISVGVNAEGDPAPIVVQNLEASGIQIVQLNRVGTTLFNSDGKNVTLLNFD